MISPVLPLAVGALVALTGCSEANANISALPGVDSVPEPVSAGDRLPGDFYDQALASSVAVINSYLEESDLITSQSGDSPERITRWVSPAWYPSEEQGFQHYQSTGERTWGETRFEDYVVQLARVTPEKTMDVAVYGCVDTTDVFVLGPGQPDPPAEVLAWHPGDQEFEGGDEEWEIIQGFYSLDGVRFGDRRAIVFWLVGDSLDSLTIDSSSQWWGAHAC
jgi:hypothetical protein